MANLITRDNRELARGASPEHRVDPFRVMDALLRWDLEKRSVSMNGDDSCPSRRQVVSGMATVIAAGMTARSALAETKPGPTAQGTPPSTAPRNPLDGYPKPPFPRQSQDWPGSQSKMMPRPDCGERSYRGTGRLLGRKALITAHLPAEEPDAREVVALIKGAGR